MARGLGGTGERKTLRLVARYADACNLFDQPETIEHKLTVLREHCDQLGRDFAEIERTVTSAPDLAGGGQALLDHLGELAGLGIDHVLVAPPGGWDRARLEAVTAILPEVHRLAAG